MAEQFPTYEPRGPRVTIGLKADSNDYERLQVEAKRAGIGQSDIVHILLEMVRLRIYSAQGLGDQRVDRFPTEIEAFVHLIAQDCGLLSEADVESAAWAAEHWTETKFKDRAAAVFGLLARRFAEKYGPVESVDEGIIDEPPQN